MKFNKYKGFTVAELMIMLAVLTVLLAAFAPVFTVRYKNALSDTVWNYVPNDDNYDAYADNVNKALPAQLFIGLQPGGKSEAESMVSNGSNVLYSKLIIAASNKLNIPKNERQKQIRFQYGDDALNREVGSLFAGNGSIMLGGAYKDITDNSSYNTAFGYNALTYITSGKRNSAFGYNAGYYLETGNDNTMVGYNAGMHTKSAEKNTYIGTEAYSTDGNYNTIIGNYAQPYSITSYNTIVGEYAGTGAGGAYNTAIGYNAMSKRTVTGYNTAVGAYAMSNTSWAYNTEGMGGYNTAIGYGACAGLHGAASYKTCIGNLSGVDVNNYSKNSFLLQDSYERVYIGPMPFRMTSPAKTKFGGAAVLEIHNLNSKGTHENKGQNANMGDSTVLINGNLIVRGQPFLQGKTPGTIAGNGGLGSYRNKPALYGFKAERPKDATHLHVLMGWDARQKHVRVNGRHGKRHAKYGAGESCTCARYCGNASDGYMSYDWSSGPTRGKNDNRTLNLDWNFPYKDLSLNKTCTPTRTSHDDDGIDLNHAHGGDGTCCPVLTSDIRLKDLGDNFTAGLEEIKKINIFNYTYKNDSEQLPHVGVVAQDLKRVFPTAVTKDENGYYKIRWDEMLYAVINSVKTLNAKIEEISDKIANDRKRIAALKKDNTMLTAKVKALADELSELEQK